MPATILVVESHLAVRRALRSWLEAVLPETTVVEAGNGEEAVAAAQATSPQVVVMDIDLRGANGIAAMRRFLAAVPSARVVVFSIHEDRAHRADAAAAGAVAFVPKRTMQTNLIPALAALLEDAGQPERGPVNTAGCP